MKTLVVQSYRTQSVAPWIRSCLDSVEAWTKARNYQYEFVDDRLFDYAPAWVRQRCGAQILPVTDVARLYLLRERLIQGWERVVWIDADVLVFAPELFALDDSARYSVCHEIWLSVAADNSIKTVEAVNNAVTVICRGHPMLEFWIFAAEEILRTRAPGEIGPLIVGTRFLTDLATTMPLRILRNVGLFSPPVVRDVARGGGEIARKWATRFGTEIGAVNLCASLQDRVSGGDCVGATEMQQAASILLNTHGRIVNQHIGGARRTA
jgi:hypothetical protein